jgi:hypothetical protein
MLAIWGDSEWSEQDMLAHTLDNAKLLVAQTGSRKAVDNRAELCG